jgi:hypothetical protein
MLQGKVESVRICSLRRLRELPAELHSNDNMLPPLLLAMAATPRSAAIPSFFFLQAGGRAGPDKSEALCEDKKWAPYTYTTKRADFVY